MSNTNVLERCQAEDGGLRDQTGGLQILAGDEGVGFSFSRWFRFNKNK